MSVDVAVAVPAFMDMTFVGLEGLPGLGEERFAGDLVRSPGGGAITAIGAAQLGLSTVLAAPLGEDAAGELIAPMLEQAGVQLVRMTLRSR
jgi:ribokinase